MAPSLFFDFKLMRFFLKNQDAYVHQFLHVPENQRQWEWMKDYGNRHRNQQRSAYDNYGGYGGGYGDETLIDQHAMVPQALEVSEAGEPSVNGVYNLIKM